MFKNFYTILTRYSAPILERILRARLQRGKEDPDRIHERRGGASRPRPEGGLIWVHAASIGEAQSALIIIEKLLQLIPHIHILVTTGTITSAQVLEKKLPARAFHQFYPLDHPDWTKAFLAHWQPDFILWMESELWPNMLGHIHEQGIPAVLVNARLSAQSYTYWRFFKSFAHAVLKPFVCVICQTEKDAVHYKSLGAQHVVVSDNLKFSANPLPYHKDDLLACEGSTRNRPLWLFASTHKGEEEMACRVHKILKARLPDLLTIIVPRHPDRKDEIAQTCAVYNDLNIAFRGAEHKLPAFENDIFIADTLGELGLFYRLAPIACIGRSFSDDGGGGHNPIEAAQLGCAILHGGNVQNLQDIYNALHAAGAALQMQSEGHLTQTLSDLLSRPDLRDSLQKKSLAFAKSKAGIITLVMDEIIGIIKRETALIDTTKT